MSEIRKWFGCGQGEDLREMTIFVDKKIGENLPFERSENAEG